MKERNTQSLELVDPVSYLQKKEDIMNYNNIIEASRY